jgi:hypothetical protein
MFQAQHKKPRGFHKKPAQRAQEENKINLNARHEQKLKQFEQALSKTLPAKEKQLQVLEKQIEKLLEVQQKNGRLIFVEQEQLYELRQQIKEMHDEIEQLKSREQENDYVLKTAPVIAEYNVEDVSGSMLSTTPGTGVGLTKWIKKDVKDVVVSIAPENGGESATTTLKNWMRGEKRPKNSHVDRRELLEAWCIKAVPNYVTSKPFSHEQPNRCPDPDCGAINQIANSNGGRVNCAICGTEIDVTFAPRHTSFKETKTTELVPEFPYKRINHFQEWLSQIQGKQNTEIVEKVFTGLQIEFVKHKKVSQELTPKFVKGCLRKLGFTKYYEHAEYIIHHFNGLPPPVLIVETEEEFREMFREIQIPFALCKPPNRKNFLSYSYIFHQFAMLTGEDHLLEHFPLLKSRPKLKIQDDIWRDMCKILKWEFIPTV